MYLKEIGQVPLLDTNRETWLSIQIAAERMLEERNRPAEPDGRQRSARTAGNHSGGLRRRQAQLGRSGAAQAKRFKLEPPNLKAIIDEVQSLTDDWDVSGSSYDPRIPAPARVGARRGVDGTGAAAVRRDSRLVPDPVPRADLDPPLRIDKEGTLPAQEQFDAVADGRYRRARNAARNASRKSSAKPNSPPKR